MHLNSASLIMLACSRSTFTNAARALNASVVALTTDSGPARDINAPHRHRTHYRFTQEPRLPQDEGLAIEQTCVRSLGQRRAELSREDATCRELRQTHARA